MAVYEHRYAHYGDALTPARTRFLVIARAVSREVFRSRITLIFFCACFLPPLVFGVLIYLRYNLNALATLKLNLNQLVRIDSSFFEILTIWQSVLAYLLVFLTVPPLIARDVANNGLPLYLCRPISRAEYVLGKFALPLLLVSAVTWIPELLLFAMQALLAGGGWFGANAWLARAMLLASIAWGITILLLAFAVSAWLKTRTAAGAALIGVFIIPQIIATIISHAFSAPWVTLISISDVMRVISVSLFRLGAVGDPLLQVPVWSAWLAIAGICGLSLLMLERKVRAYEVSR